MEVTTSKVGANTYIVTCYSGANGTGLSSTSRSCSIEGLDPNLTITADPEQVRRGDASTISWSAQGVDQCLINSDDGQFKAPFTVGGTAVVSGSQGTGALDQETSYYLQCSNAGATFERTATVSIIPEYEEF